MFVIFKTSNKDFVLNMSFTRSNWWRTTTNQAPIVILLASTDLEPTISTFPKQSPLVLLAHPISLHNLQY